MESKQSFKLQWFLPLVLIILSSVLGLYTQNVNTLFFGEAILLACILSSGAVLLCLFCFFIYKEIPKASLFTAYLLIFFFYFHYGLEALNAHTLDRYGAIFLRMRYLLVLFTLLSIFLFYKIMYMRKTELFLLRMLTVLFGILCIMEAGRIIHQEYLFSQIPVQTFQEPIRKPIEGKSLPDIYFIIPDMYTSSEMLKKYYNYDNKAFLDKLKKLRFIIPNKSYSNYPNTQASLSATFQMNYHEPKNNFFKALHNNRACRILEESGLTFINIKGASSVTRPLTSTKTNRFLRYWHKSYYALTAAFDLLFSFLKSRTVLLYISEIRQLEKARSRSIALEQLEELKQSVHINGPKFVLCHFIYPHPPFCVDKNGHLTPEKREIPFEKGYPAQVEFISKKLEHTIEYILTHSSRQPIIILQSDHGAIRDIVFLGNQPQLNPFPISLIRQAFSILNAWYIPPEYKISAPVPTSPINNFRFLLKQYFGYDISMLKERSFMYQTEKFHNKFVAVSSLIKSSNRPNFIPGASLYGSPAI